MSSMAAKRLNLSTFCSALLALGGVGVLEFSSGPVEATIGDLICMASPILIGLSPHLIPDFGSQYASHRCHRIPQIVKAPPSFRPFMHRSVTPNLKERRMRMKNIKAQRKRERDGILRLLRSCVICQQAALLRRGHQPRFGRGW